MSAGMCKLFEASRERRNILAHMPCETVTCRVIESKSPDFKVGEVVVGSFGWRTHTIVTEQAMKSSMVGVFKVDLSLPVSPSTALGVLGLPGYVCVSVLLHY